ncbi:5'-methylthioadenosine nucleosidase [Thalassospira lucentensis]|uniref:5'-methylthioadenosine nucleosidase n=1 Tax=Thalassospira lucentensis TaxID=168935 RepID=A0A154L8J9_9PROT|nr:MULTISPECIES: 5'-methylthioadenosine/S-adenosylhomocysteine nucleosidase [Thalassospira]KZB66853.1 5'-methylthioadenosine nucleosidase [Thalassospira lucentensis]MCH2273491.1 5'-methylthioadenosine/S-adenosylhomocysteine nucleosidase [Thalassospira sp.]
MRGYLHDFAGTNVLFAMAANQEYGPHLEKLFKPLMIGIGPVEAAINLSIALTELKLANDLPDLVVTLGSAGSRTLDQAKVYQVSSVSYRDMDCSALGFERGITPYLNLPAVLDLPYRIPTLPEARLSTGANVVSGDAYNAIDADMVDMETYAVLRVCQKFDVPVIGLRGISDGKEELNTLSDWTTYLHVVDENLAKSVDIIKGQINLKKLNKLRR